MTLTDLSEWFAPPIFRRQLYQIIGLQFHGV
jgi:hypothetical protein